MSILYYVILCFDRLIATLYALIMGLEDRQNNQHDNIAQDAEPNSEAHRGLNGVDDVESGFHILARMIADFHLRRKGSCKHSSSDEKRYKTPR